MKKIKCLKCPSKAHYNGLCRKHFMEQIEGRVKREIREKGMIKKDDILAVNDPLSRFFLKKVMAGMPLKFARSAGKKSGAKTVVLWTLDDEVISFLNGFFAEYAEHEGGYGQAQDRQEIRPFRTVKEDEMIAYARLAGIKLKMKKREKAEEEIKKALERIEDKHAETKFSIIRSIEEIKKLA